MVDAIVRNGSVYFAAIGGAGALLSQRIKKSEVVAYDDLGTEAIRKLEVEDFPVVVVIDSQGNNLYGDGNQGISEIISDEKAENRQPEKELIPRFSGIKV